MAPQHTPPVLNYIMTVSQGCTNRCEKGEFNRTVSLSISYRTEYPGAVDAVHLHQTVAHADSPSVIMIPPLSAQLQYTCRTVSLTECPIWDRVVRLCCSHTPHIHGGNSQLPAPGSLSPHTSQSMVAPDAHPTSVLVQASILSSARHTLLVGSRRSPRCVIHQNVAHVAAEPPGHVCKNQSDGRKPPCVHLAILLRGIHKGPECTLLAFL